MLNYFSFLGSIDNFFLKSGKSPAEEKLNTPTNPDFLKLEFDNKIIFQRKLNEILREFFICYYLVLLFCPFIYREWNRISISSFKQIIR